MTTQTKLEMTEKNLLKNMKRLNKESVSPQRNELFNYAQVKNNQTVTTDSSRALKINQIVENEFTRHDEENFDRVDKLLTESYTDYNYKVVLNRTEIDDLRKIAKLLKSLTQSLEFTYDKGNVSISNRDSVHVYDNSFQLSYKLNSVDNSQLDSKDSTIKTVFNPSYLADMLDFAYDNKDDETMLVIQESGLKPAYMRPYLSRWESYDYMTMPLRVY